jgi:NhaP-type Na+/H+ or K+/H+ antiporter
VQVDKIDPKSLGYGLVVLLLALVLRMVATYFAVSCGNLNTKEKIFMAFAWLPKATVQAALGKKRRPEKKHIHRTPGRQGALPG